MTGEYTCQIVRVATAIAKSGFACEGERWRRIGGAVGRTEFLRAGLGNAELAEVLLNLVDRDFEPLRLFALGVEKPLGAFLHALIEV
jgi:hypothetical protein